MKRKIMRFIDLASMPYEDVDHVPMPVEFVGLVGKGKKCKEVRLRKTWVGFGWVDEGEADGTEPTLVFDDTVPKYNKLLKEQEFEYVYSK